jgi:chromatin structure-remodeling complex subunit SFH1
VQIGTHHLQDHVEWDLLSPLTPEAFATQLCADLGLAGEAAPLIAHAVHEELLRHKRDALEWGVLGGAAADADSVLKDKTGLGLGWGKAPKDGRGRGPKTLRSVWRDWQEAEEFATRFEVLTAEEVERRELERERASRCVRVSAGVDGALTAAYKGDSGEKRASSRAEQGGDGGNSPCILLPSLSRMQCDLEGYHTRVPEM